MLGRVPVKFVLPLASLACGLWLAIGACASDRQASSAINTPPQVAPVSKLPEAKLARSQAFTPTDLKSFKVETVTEGLEVPWSIEFLPDRSILVTERPGRLRIIRGGKLDPKPIAGLPTIAVRGEGGLMDLALHPQFSRNKWLYLAYTIEGAGGLLQTRVSRFRLTDTGLTEKLDIFPGVPGTAAGNHFGSRLAFGRDGKLYITLGERGESKRAQDLKDLNGKTLRLNDNGTIPPDNPYVKRTDARPEIFSYGHRNAQGIAIQPKTGAIFQTEHGPSGYDGRQGGDEVNVVEAGKNYGWPNISYNRQAPGQLPPLLLYQDAIAPAGATFYTGKSFPQWQGNFFFANLRGRALIRVALDGIKVIGQEKLLPQKYGRLRDVKEGPDGFLYITTSDNDGYGDGRTGGDRIIRLVPNS
ncbi:PQQ-dependent sugar dehydrogenase [Chamaesiphon sp. VAR_48_metabat_403]|uniref:PQQ-dependent sugar dehydrogenase n=1 Tax=Chamaesiphon sp. VAR_48_metabat_403 TaxID=2964700 RepID=UPI00286DE48B|nr:PQQ-dependent sugar dehydrogenase [Chamaesiphon sp. VAR_48_metabat_403]